MAEGRSSRLDWLEEETNRTLLLTLMRYSLQSWKKSFRAMISVALELGLIAEQTDVHCAFPHADYDRVAYLVCPKDFIRTRATLFTSSTKRCMGPSRPIGFGLKKSLAFSRDVDSGSSSQIPVSLFVKHAMVTNHWSICG